jgi:4-diphosphocytidyl-2-C-methyl-D-erythritol kinase
MIVFAPAKMNLGLYVTSKRSDGFHNIETVFYPLPLTDVVEVAHSKNFLLTEYGLSASCSPEENICFKTWELLHNVFKIGHVHIHLLKNIPVQAGLGGGSSNAIAVMKALNTLFDLQMSNSQMHQLALQLGSDCPFFVDPVPSLAVSRGEKLSPLHVDLKGKHIVLFKPSFGISTAEAFQGVAVEKNGQLGVHILEDIQNWKHNVKNIFEDSFLKKFPHLLHLKNGFYSCGAEFVSMSGSGSCFFAIFDKFPKRLPDVPNDYYLRKLVL